MAPKHKEHVVSEIGVSSNVKGKEEAQLDIKYFQASNEAINQTAEQQLTDEIIIRTSILLVTFKCWNIRLHKSSQFNFDKNRESFTFKAKQESSLLVIGS